MCLPHRLQHRLQQEEPYLQTHTAWPVNHQDLRRLVQVVHLSGDEMRIFPDHHPDHLQVQRDRAVQVALVILQLHKC